MPTRKRTRKKTNQTKGSIHQRDAAPERKITAATNKKQNVPSISSAVRRLVVTAPQLTLSEISARLVKDGWNPEEIERRKSTIATLRTDTLAILTIAREEGWRAPNKRN